MIDNSTPIHARGRGQRLKRFERRDFKRLWLEHYIQTLNITQSCKAVGVSRAALYRWFDTDEKFQEKYQSISAVYFLSFLPYACTEEQRKTHMKREKYGRELIKRFNNQHPDAQDQHNRPMGILANYEAMVEAYNLARH